MLHDADIRMVQHMPTLVSRDQPVIAIVTRLYCEKLAVDAMIENKVTYVRYKTEGKSFARIWTQRPPFGACGPAV